MKSQTYIFLYSLNVSHCSKASHYKITHLQMVQGLLFSFGISNRNKSAHSSRHTFSSICVCLCMAHERDAPKENSSPPFLLRPVGGGGGASESCCKRDSRQRLWLLLLQNVPQDLTHHQRVPFWGSTKGRHIRGICGRGSAHTHA